MHRPERWAAFCQWCEQRPWWARLLLFVPLGPVLAALFLVSICPRLWLAAAGLVLGVYGGLLWAGFYSWPEGVDQAAHGAKALLSWYVVIMLGGLAGMLRDALDRRFGWCTPAGAKATGDEARARLPGRPA